MELYFQSPYTHSNVDIRKKEEKYNLLLFNRICNRKISLLGRWRISSVHRCDNSVLGTVMKSGAGFNRLWCGAGKTVTWLLQRLLDQPSTASVWTVTRPCLATVSKLQLKQPKPAVSCFLQPAEMQFGGGGWGALRREGLFEMCVFYLFAVYLTMLSVAEII